MQLKINLATKSYINFRQLNLAIIVAVSILFVISVFNLTGFIANSDETTRVNKELAFYTGKLTGDNAIPEKDYQNLLSRIRFANEIIDKKTFDWLALLNNLEKVVPDGIAISAVIPGEKEELKITGAAKDFHKVETFMENLEGSKDFNDVFLVSQSDMKFGQTQQGIVFNITCRIKI